MQVPVTGSVSSKGILRRMLATGVALACVSIWTLPASAESEDGHFKKRKKPQQQEELLHSPDDQQPVFGSQQKTARKKKSEEPLTTPTQTNFNSGSSGGKATTETEVVVDRNVAPILTAGSMSTMQSAIARYENIVASGGWTKVPAKRLAKGDTGEEVTILKRRLVAEGYLQPSTLEGEKGTIFTTAAEQAVKQFQLNHGLSASGKLDKATVNAMNVPANRRLATLRANMARVAEYSKDLGSRYIVVNVPGLQLESVENGRVFSRHNIIVGKPERPSPIVMTNLSDINFNPYWNVPVSIVERDLIPQILKGGPQAMIKQDIRIFDGFDGPEINPEDVDWTNTPAERYFFRQDPGESNAMATVKINFPSPFGVYMHDTPTRSLFNTAGRYLSSGCVRVDKVSVLVNWILNGQDGWNPGRIAAMADSLERLDVKLANPPQIRWVYLTAWATPSGQVNFRDDIYELDGTGFVVGQPMPVGEYSDDGQRYVLKPIPRAPQASPVDGFSDDDFDIFGSNQASARKNKNQVSTAPRAEPGSSLGFSTTQQGIGAKKKQGGAKTASVPAAKTTSNSAFNKLKNRNKVGAAAQEEPEVTKPIKKKKKKSVEAANVPPAQ
jgi:hypothetical protein